MKTSNNQHASQDGKEPHPAKDDKSISAHSHGKHDKHGTSAKPEQSGTVKPPDAPANPLEAKLADLEDRQLRLLADFDNYRKRSLREKETTARLVRENMLMELLPVIDSIELGINAALSHKKDKAFVDGYRMVSDQLSAALAKFGLQQQQAQGAQFDANLHEAVQQVLSEEHPAGTVLAVIRKGYLSGDVVLRPAQVVVSSGSAAAKPAEQQAEDVSAEESVEEPEDAADDGIAE